MRILILLAIACSAPPVNPPAPPQPAPAPHPHPSAAERPGAAHHGECCTSDASCGGIACLPYEYQVGGCTHVCTLPCESGEMCPSLGGGQPVPIACPATQHCPVGRPGT